MTGEIWWIRIKHKNVITVAQAYTNQRGCLVWRPVCQQTVISDDNVELLKRVPAYEAAND